MKPVNLREVQGANGLFYRGPMPCQSPKTPWRIIYHIPGRKGWRTSERFQSAEHCSARLGEIEAAALEMIRKRGQ